MVAFSGMVETASLLSRKNSLVSCVMTSHVLLSLLSSGRACGPREDFIMPEPYVMLMRRFSVAEVRAMTKDS